MSPLPRLPLVVFFWHWKIVAMAASMLACATDGTKLLFTSDGETAPKILVLWAPTCVTEFEYVP